MNCLLNKIKLHPHPAGTDACCGNKTHAAKTLQIDYKILLSKLKQYTGDT